MPFNNINQSYSFCTTGESHERETSQRPLPLLVQTEHLARGSDFDAEIPAARNIRRPRFEFLRRSVWTRAQGRHSARESQVDHGRPGLRAGQAFPHRADLEGSQAEGLRQRARVCVFVCAGLPAHCDAISAADKACLARDGFGV